MGIADFDKKYTDKGITQKLRDIKERGIILDSGLFGFNIAHGIGGVRTGAVMRVMGPPGVGKSSVTYRLLASGLAQGMSGFVCDMEGGVNPAILADTLEDAGLDPDDPNLPLRIISPVGNETEWGDKNYPTIERIVPLIETWIDDKNISPNGAVVIIDSVDGLAADAMIGSKVDDATVALISRRLKNWLRLYHYKIVQSKSLVIFVHQRSANITPMARDKEAFTGGNAVDHWSKVNLRLKDIGQEMVGGEQVGRKVKGIITKSKQGLPWRTFEYVIRFDVGPDNYTAVFEAAKKLGIIKTKGAWVEVPNIDNLVQGKDAVRDIWVNDHESFRCIEKLVMDQIGNNVDIVAPAAEGEDREQEEFNTTDDE